MDKNESLIEEIYKNAKMGGDSIVDLLDRADVGQPNAAELKSEMTYELGRYRGFEKRAEEKLGERGLKPKELPLGAKMGAKVGMFFNTMLDTSPSHLAEMMINGASMGIVELEKKLNDGGYSPEAESFAREVADYEKSTIERLGKFL